MNARQEHYHLIRIAICRLRLEMGVKFVPEPLPEIAVNDRVELTKSIKVDGVLLMPGISGKVIFDLKPLFGVSFGSKIGILNVNARYLKVLFDP
jgi:hypothetical protein